MTSPVTIALRAEGASSVLQALHSVRAAMVDIEKHSAALGALHVGPTAAAASAVQAEAAARIAALKAEVKVTEELARARATAGGAGAGAGGGGSGGAARGGKGPTTAAEMFKAGAALLGLQSAINYATASLKQFGGFILSDVVRPAMAMQTRSVQVANNSGGKLTSDEVQRKARGIGIRNNMDPMALIDAAGIFQDATGESKLGFDMMSTVATLSKARGFDTKELSGLAGALFKPGMQKAELDQLLLTATAQGTMGSVTLGQQAKLGGKLTAPAGSFAGDYGTRLAMSGALLQSGRKGFGSVDEAAAGLQSFVTDSMHAGKTIKGAITKGADGVEHITDPAKLIGDLFRKTQGNSTKLTALGYSEPASKLVGSYRETYSEAFKASKAHGETDAQSKEDGAEAVEKFIKSFVTASTTMETEESKRDAVLATSGERFESTMTGLKDKLLAVMPAVDKVINIFGDTLATSGDDLVGVVMLVIDALSGLASGAQAMAEWYKDKTTVYGQGDVKRVRHDNGDKTVLEAQEEKGYWRKNKSNFEYVIDNQDPQKMGMYWKTVGGKTAWYNQDDANDFDAKKAKENKAAFDKDVDSRVKRGDYSLFGPRADDATGAPPGASESAWKPGDAPAGVSTEAGTSDVAKKADDASAALVSLKKNIDDVNASFGELNRNASFGPTS
jgi:hypothetical protein